MDGSGSLALRTGVAKHRSEVRACSLLAGSAHARVHTHTSTVHKHTTHTRAHTRVPPAHRGRRRGCHEVDAPPLVTSTWSHLGVLVSPCPPHSGLGCAAASKRTRTCFASGPASRLHPEPEGVAAALHQNRDGGGRRGEEGSAFREIIRPLQQRPEKGGTLPRGAHTLREMPALTPPHTLLAVTGGPRAAARCSCTPPSRSAFSAQMLRFSRSAVSPKNLSFETPLRTVLPILSRFTTWSRRAASPYFRKFSV